MVEARWKGAVLAESEDTVVVEGNHYFPPGDVDGGLLVRSDHVTTCPWKGEARYYHVEVDGRRLENAAFAYEEPKPEAAEIEDRIAFWKDVTVEA